MMFVAIRFDGQLFGGLNFYSRTPGRFVRDDVLIARRITDHVALALSHARIAEEARRGDSLRARATNLELLDELLGALIDSGDLPDVFARVSTIAGKVLRHDALALTVALSDGRHARIYANSGFPIALPEVIDLPEDLLSHPNQDHDIFDDLSVRTEPRYARLAGMGFQSLLRVPIRLDGQFAGAFILLSKSLSSFGRRTSWSPTALPIVSRSRSLAIGKWRRRSGRTKRRPARRNSRRG